MNCPKCQSQQTIVYNSRPKDSTTWRRRKCLDCKHRWTTIEVTEDVFDFIDQIDKAIGTLKALGNKAKKYRVDPTRRK
jgi:transcriptional regulator NrdR family protein